MNMRARMKEQTAKLPAAADIVVDAVASADDPRPKTAVGAMAALSAAKLRIQELESQGAASTRPVDKIRPNPWQPRIKFDDESLATLAASIKAIGLLQPILVRRLVTEDGEEFYELVAGERRWRAHQLNSMDTIQVIIVDASDADMAVFALTENIARDALTDYEISKGVIRAESEFPNRKRMAEEMGIPRAALYRYLAFKHLPQFIINDLEVRPGLLGGHAADDTVKLLAKVGDGAHTLAKQLWQQVVSGSLDQTKYAQTLQSALMLANTPTPVALSRETNKVYAGAVTAGSITKDADNFTVRLKSKVLTADQEARIRALISEIFTAK